MPERKTYLTFDYDEIALLVEALYPGFSHDDTNNEGMTFVCDESSVDMPPNFAEGFRIFNQRKA